MPHRDGIHIEEEELPGFGMRDDFMTGSGRRVGVITRRNGQRDLLVYKKNDPDSVSETISLTEGEADILAEYLGTRRVVERLSRVIGQIDDLNSETVEVHAGSPADGKTLGDLNIKPTTGASVVAVWRGGEVLASPKLDFVFHRGDTVIIIGTSEALAAAKQLINGA